ncbi:GIY-YIG nuclease family protein [Candidatus Shapirobacteria bacterium]|nr:GIY-YIG nuclease family protein [Candidatus Shapirobacteria bacterium]
MYYVYALLGLKNRRLYIGYTGNLARRIEEHNTGQGGKYTKKNKPFHLVFYEAFLSKEDAEKQERFYKTGYGREVLRKKIENSISHCPVV